MGVTLDSVTTMLDINCHCSFHAVCQARDAHHNRAADTLRLRTRQRGADERRAA